jgi:hypothetical protein
MKGLLENNAIVAVFVKHVRTAMAELEGGPGEAEVRANGERIAFSEPLQASDGVITAQLRPTLEALGYEVSWDENAGAIVAEKAGRTLSFRTGSAYATANGTEAAMDTECRLVNGAAMVPLSFFSKHLGYSVNWDADGNINIFEK